jgi:hypothetical protein
VSPVPGKKQTKTPDSKKKAASLSPDKRSKVNADSSSNKKAKSESSSKKNKTGMNDADVDTEQTIQEIVVELMPPAPPGPPKISRSGRVVKRNSFHDERDEGEQHLKSLRYQEELRRKAAEAQIRRKKRQEAKEREKVQEQEVEVEVEAELSEEEQTAVAAAVEEDSEEVEEVEEVEDVPMEMPPARIRSMETLIAVYTCHQFPLAQVPIAKEEVAKPSLVAEPSSQEVEASESPEHETHSDSKPPATAELKPVVTTPDTQAVDAKPAPVEAPAAAASTTTVASTPLPPSIDIQALVAKAMKGAPTDPDDDKPGGTTKVPRRKPGARECMQISRRFGVKIIPKRYMDTLFDYCTRGKVEHLIRMRERLDEHSRFLESQLAGLEAIIREKGESDVVVPPLPERPDSKPQPSGSHSSPALGPVSPPSAAPVQQASSTKAFASEPSPATALAPKAPAASAPAPTPASTPAPTPQASTVQKSTAEAPAVQSSTTQALTLQPSAAISNN